jgi:uncharacterized protein
MKIVLQLVRFSAFLAVFAFIYPTLADNTNNLEIATVTSRVRFTVELAVTPDQQKIGLMGRKHLDPDRGMLFLFPTPRPIAMWMKDTLIPLDMIFIKQDGSISRIEENAKPMSTRPIRSGGPVSSVLEVAGGTAKRLDIRVGNQVLYPSQPMPQK